MTRRELVAVLVLTAITLPPLCICGGHYYLSEAERVAMGRPLPPPGDPNIGLSLLYVLGAINIPTVLAWLSLLVRYAWTKAPNHAMQRTRDKIGTDGTFKAASR
jgi:hypothetical protein